jgi:aerotaxis receptor
MKVNLPVQNVEYPYPKGKVLVSKTDAKGVITFANDAFIETSGFEKEELIGKSHNVVRHPEMPPEAFADLWATIKRGLPWKGLVKNRRKDGSYYWVNAFVVPMFKGGEPDGFMSVRTEPTREQIEAASALYEQVRAKKVILSHEPNFLQRLSLKARFKILLGLLGLFILGIGLNSLIGIDHGQRNFNRGMETSDAIADATGTARHAQVAFKKQVQEWKNILLRGQDDKAYEKHLKSFEKDEKETKELLKALKPHLARLQIDTRKVDETLAAHDILSEKYREALAKFDRSRPDGYKEVDKMVSGIDRPPTKGLDDIVAEVEKTGNERLKEIQRLTEAEFSAGRVANYGLFGLNIAVALLAFFIIMKTIGGLTEAMGFFRHIAQGRLDNDIPTEGRDEVGGMLAGLAAMQVQTRVMLDELRHAVISLTESMTAMDAATAQASQQAAEQHDGVMRVSAAMEEVAVSVGEVASHAADVVGAAESSLGVVNSGSATMERSISITHNVVASVHDSVETISALATAVEKISGVTQVIKEIADQTNLLALNAAIEAARAGEQGRGFAVVADEVRKLAERTGNSTSDIATMLAEVDTSTRQVVESMRRAEGQVGDARTQLEQMSESFGAIKEGSQRVTDMAESIAHATKEQATANQDVARNMEKMSMSIEETLQAIEGVRRSTQAMSITTDELNGILRQYNLA